MSDEFLNTIKIVTIMIVRFINRQIELNYLEEIASSPRAELVVVYGRRRVGKTRLLLEFLKRRGGLYFYIPNGGKGTVLRSLSQVVEANFYPGFTFREFDEFLRYLSRWFTEHRGGVVVLDEFQNLSILKGAVSLLQKSWDEEYSRIGAKLILAGSSVGMIERVSLRGDAPLYGRKTGVVELEPLHPAYLAQWFPRLEHAKLVELYGVFGGTPAYLELVNPSRSVEDNVKRLILDKRGPLYREPEFLLMEEVRTPARYVDILGAISQGKITLSEISDYTGISRENVTTYLATLISMRLVAKESTPTKKASRYTLTDPFFEFWFRFVLPNRPLLEHDLQNQVWEKIKQEYNAYLGRVFERIARLHIASKIRKGELVIHPDYLGAWWDKDVEIDIVALSTREGKAVLFEAKWSTLTQKEARRILESLIQKATKLPTHQNTYGLVAKDVYQKEKLLHEGFIVYTLSDIFNPNQSV